MNINDFKHMMPHTVTHEPVSSRNSYGKITYGTAVSRQSRVSYKQRQIRAANGELTMSTGVVWFAAVVNVDHGDRITLPDGTTPQILSVETHADDKGDRFTKLYFG